MKFKSAAASTMVLLAGLSLSSPCYAFAGAVARVLAHAVLRGALHQHVAHGLIAGAIGSRIGAGGRTGVGAVLFGSEPYEAQYGYFAPQNPPPSAYALSARPQSNSAIALEEQYTLAHAHNPAGPPLAIVNRPPDFQPQRGVVARY